MPRRTPDDREVCEALARLRMPGTGPVIPFSHAEDAWETRRPPSAAETQVEEWAVELDRRERRIEAAEARLETSRRRLREWTWGIVASFLAVALLWSTYFLRP